MIKGVARQVIVVQSPDRKMFEQAIFIIRDDVPEVTDEYLLKEANRLISRSIMPHKRNVSLYGIAWAMIGAGFTTALWLISVLL